MVEIRLDNLTKIYPGKKRRKLLQKIIKVVFRRKQREIEEEEKDVVAVDHVTLTVKDSGYFTVLGPSGSGKSTTLGIIAGHIEPDEGRVYFGNTDVTGYPPHQRDAVMVPQNLALFPHMIIEENVKFGLDYRKICPKCKALVHPKAKNPIQRLAQFLRLKIYETHCGVNLRKLTKNEKKDKVKTALKMVGLDHRLFGHRKIRELSGGQKQRVALARALITESAVWLLDEALGALDAKLRVEMREEIRSLQREGGITAINVTHDQVEALSSSDEIGIMNEGRIEQVGTPVEIYKNPETRFVADFIGRVNFCEGEVLDSSTGKLHGLDRQVSLYGVEPPLIGKTATFMCRPEELAINKDMNGKYIIERMLDYSGAEATYEISKKGLKALRLQVRMTSPTQILNKGTPVNLKFLSPWRILKEH
jgi:ABC-type Fe3+/spermidine/putrescine transport system ATPase subunit